MPLFLLGFLAACLGGNIYLFVRTLPLLTTLPTPWRWLFGGLFWVAALALFMAMACRHGDLPAPLARGLFVLGSCWMLFMFYMVLLLLGQDLLRLLGVPLTHPLPTALTITLLVMSYGYWNYRHPRIERISITSAEPLKKPCRIVAVSDIHLGEGTRKRALKRYVELINAQSPDLILIGGDLIDNAIKPVRRQHMEEELSQLRAPLGVWMVPGNHEYISGIDACIAFLESTPVRLLRDEVVELPNGLQLIGRDDRSNRRRLPLEELLKSSDPGRPRLLLDHQPYELGKADSLGVDLQFYGHTHRGQVWPLNRLVDRLYPQSHGSRSWEHGLAIVSSGLSLWGPPFRIGTHSDLWVIEWQNEP